MTRWRRRPATPAVLYSFGPMDVFEAGRMVMLQDPHGAAFAAWQPKQHIGCRVKQEAGAMTWNELVTSDSTSAIEFYEGVLGIERGITMGPMDYTLLRAGGNEVAGVLQITEDMGPIPPHWAVYFGVDDVDETVAKAQSLGADVYVPPTDIPENRPLRVSCRSSRRGFLTSSRQPDPVRNPAI